MMRSFHLAHSTQSGTDDDDEVGEVVEGDSNDESSVEGDDIASDGIRNLGSDINNDHGEKEYMTMNERSSEKCFKIKIESSHPDVEVREFMVSSGVVANLETWEQVHQTLQEAVWRAERAVAIQKAQRRYWLEEICANLTNDGKLTQNSVWKTPVPIHKKTKTIPSKATFTNVKKNIESVKQGLASTKRKKAASVDEDVPAETNPKKKIKIEMTNNNTPMEKNRIHDDISTSKTKVGGVRIKVSTKAKPIKIVSKKNPNVDQSDKSTARSVVRTNDDEDGSIASDKDDDDDDDEYNSLSKIKQEESYESFTNDDQYEERNDENNDEDEDDNDDDDSENYNYENGHDNFKSKSSAHRNSKVQEDLLEDNRSGYQSSDYHAQISNPNSWTQSLQQPSESNLSHINSHQESMMLGMNAGIDYNQQQQQLAAAAIAEYQRQQLQQQLYQQQQLAYNSFASYGQSSLPSSLPNEQFRHMQNQLYGPPTLRNYSSIQDIASDEDDSDQDRF